MLLYNGSMSKSLFLEGTDGSGKSTQFELLKKYLEDRGEKVLTLREPGGSDYYEALRDFYLHAPHEHPPISDALISAAGRAANIELTKKALSEGTWVITDRAYPSSFVYQAVQGIDLADIKDINRHALQGFDYDIKILLDVSIEVAMSRVEQSGAQKDHWESNGIEFFTLIREKYLELAKSEDYIIIDGSGEIEAIHQEIIKHLG